MLVISALRRQAQVTDSWDSWNSQVSLPYLSCQAVAWQSLSTVPGSVEGKGKGVSVPGVENQETNWTTNPVGKGDILTLVFAMSYFTWVEEGDILAGTWKCSCLWIMLRFEKEGKPSTSKFDNYLHSALYAVHLLLLLTPAIIVVVLLSQGTRPGSLPHPKAISIKA